MSPFLFPIFRAFDNDGNPLAGGKVYTYASGTSSPKATYTDATGASANTNPVILDSEGYASIWGEGAYRLVITDSNDVTIQTIDGFTNDRGATGPAGTFQMADAGGTVDAITATYNPVISLSDRTTVGIVSMGENTIPDPTFAPDGLTAHTIVKAGGQPLAAGDIGAAGSVHFLTYDLGNTRWELANPTNAAVVESIEDSIAGTSGSFTPELKFGGAAVGMTYTTQTGKYYRVGDLCVMTIDIELSAKGSSTGTATITGLPFANDTGCPVSVHGEIDATPGFGGVLGGDIQNGETTIRLRVRANGEATIVDDTKIANSTIIRVQLTCKVTD